MKSYIKIVLIFKLIFSIIFGLSDCYSFLIDENGVEKLRNSLNHLTERKTVKTVPNDCNDRPNVYIDIVFKEESVNSSVYYAVFANKTYYVRLEGISRDHLPIVRRDTQPQPVDQKFKLKMIGKHEITEYKFVGPVYLYRIPTEKGKYSLIGFNQVWLGCPQPMCISPGFDGILNVSPFNEAYHYMSRRSSDRIIILFRGNYFWYYEMGKDHRALSPPLVDRAKKIDERWIDTRINNFRYNPKTRAYERGYLNDSMVVPTYMDAIVPGMSRFNNCIYFIKKDEFVCYEFFSQVSKPMKIADEWKSTNDEWKSAKIDAAFYIKGLIYFIAADKLWCFSPDRVQCQSYPKILKQLHRNFPTDISSAFPLAKNIIVIKGVLYYEIPIDSFPMKIKDQDMVPKFIFQDLLGCDDAHYTAWGFESYESFILKFAKKMRNGLIGFEHDYSEAHFNPNFLIVSVLLIVTSIITIFGIWHYKPLWINSIINFIKSPFK